MKFTIMWVFFDIIVNFIIQKLKSKHTSLKNILSKTNIFFSHFEGTRREKKSNISHLSEMTRYSGIIERNTVTVPNEMEEEIRLKENP